MAHPVPAAAPSPRSRHPVGRARLHFAILTHGALAATQRCLRTLAATVPGPFQVFVVDNASTDRTPQWLREHGAPWLHWQLNAQNRGVPGGRNDLLDFALPHLRDDDWLVFCDNDLEFEPGWFGAYERAIAAWPAARLLGKVGHFVEVRGDRRVLLPAPTATAAVDVLSGGFGCAVRADAARAIGPFDEQLGLFWHEDDDYCVRALQCGFEVLAVPEAGIVHHEHASGVANDGLREGGSLQNQAYLAAKWRAAGWIDRDGWIRRAHGSYQPPAVRDELRRRGGLPTPVGRSEFAAAFALLDRLVAVAEPAAAFVAAREPVPRCLPPLLAWQRECALAAGDGELAARLAVIDGVLARERYAARLQPSLRVPQQEAGIVGHGLCAASDFDDPQWLAVADAIEPGHCMRDPHARDRGFWEQVSLVLSLQRVGAIVPGGRVLCAGVFDGRVAAWLAGAGMAVVRHLVTAPTSGPFDVVICNRSLDPDAVMALRAAATPAAVFAFVGDATLDGVPLRTVPQPAQIEHDLLARADLVPALAIRTVVEPDLLEACCDRSDRRERRPYLSLAGRRLLTSFVVVARPTVARARAGAVLQPAQPAAAATATIGVDLRTIAYADSAGRGIGHYTVHHLAAVARREPSLRLRCYLPAGVELPAALQLPNVQRRDVDDYAAADCDLVHLPDPMNLALGFDAPLRVFRHECTTITFHDLTPLRHYVEAWPARNRDAYLDRLQQIGRGSAVLLCNSAFTARDVVATLHLDPSRAVPILAGHNGGNAVVSQQRLAAVRHRLGLRGPFVLHVGALDPHKNFAASLSAFLQVQRRRPLQLVVVGAVDPGIEHFAEFCRTRGIDGVTFTGYLPRPDLDALYQSAVGLVFSSRSEGFGFPLLEAMAAGCPVVATDVTSHPEVVGDAGQLVPVDDPAAAAAALERLLAEPEFADRCRAAGRARAAQFSWDAVAERTLLVWRGALAHRGGPAAARQVWTPGASMPVFSTHST